MHCKCKLYWQLAVTVCNESIRQGFAYPLTIQREYLRRAHCTLMQNDHFCSTALGVGQFPVEYSRGSYRIKNVAQKKLVTFGTSHLSKFLSLHYYTPLEGVLGVQRSGQAQGTIMYLFGLRVFFGQNAIRLKNLQKSSKSIKKLLLFGILEFFQFWLENSSPNL